MEVQRYERIIEAVLFASGEPVSVSRLAEVLDMDAETVIGLCNQLSDRIDESGSALEIVRTDDKFQLCTKSEYAPYIRSALELRRNTPLSNAAMEVLAIIAYNEPVTRNLVERVRGVDCSGVMSSLLNKGLIEEKGRLDLPGRPMQYKTTTLFLRCFGMESLAQLPKLPSDTAEEIEGQMTVDDAVESAEEAV
ncbi:MAG: SMC-Scp complex subunit ScpB [Clostridia bacterium]|nr:SMC-Scp complex subunit ScpB [Clostridia bacterium]